MNHQEAIKLLNHFSPLSIHRSLKRKEWQTLKIDWYDFLGDCEKNIREQKQNIKPQKLTKNFIIKY